MNESFERLKIHIRGAVQGVGFRPFVYRLTQELGLKGWVINDSQGVFIEVEGSSQKLRNFLIQLEKEKPAHAVFQGFEYSFFDPIGYQRFEIRESRSVGAKTVLVLPDLAPCQDCLREILDSEDHRYRYPFTNCTNCGPRFSIIEGLPYDRQLTSMKNFVMCGKCLEEYSDPQNRRFHAQPNACPACGPTLELLSTKGDRLASEDQALRQAVEMLHAGKILALKGIGGFQLLVDASHPSAVSRLRERKHREEKPFALLMPDLESVRRSCEVDEIEARELFSCEAPIVLLRRKDWAGIAPEVAPTSHELGVMLPCSPLHHLLSRDFNGPLVATSGNLSEEPICISDAEALNKLSGIADLILTHNRRIVRHLDDSIVRVILGRKVVMRRARGFAPLPIRVALTGSAEKMLATGAQMKNSFAIRHGENVFLSQYLGDLENAETVKAFENGIQDFRRLYDFAPDCVICDEHPDYYSTRYAQKLELPLEQVQHHHAHMLSCMCENELTGPVLGVCWDGTGFGSDQEIWGGEFLKGDYRGFDRFAHFRGFRLPGGEQAIREPRRAALGLLFEAFGETVFQDKILKSLPPFRTFRSAELVVLEKMLTSGLNSPRTTSVGRLFDALASLLDLKQVQTYEGQAAQMLEYEALQIPQLTRSGMPDPDPKQPWILDWMPLLQEVLDSLASGEDRGVSAMRFHSFLTETVVQVAKKCGLPRVVLSGGCFQNRLLTENVIHHLRQEGFEVYWHQRVPPNDGGIALGQIAHAIHQS